VADGRAAAPDEQVIRLRAIKFVDEQWPELMRTLPARLGQSYREDDSRPQEVGARLLIRYRNGKGALVRLLTEDLDAAFEAQKEAFDADVWTIAREVIKDAAKDRVRRSSERELAANTVDRYAADLDPLESIDHVRSEAPLVGGNTEGFIASIRTLLIRGEEAWEHLCDDGVLERSEWSADEKWTAIGMMWFKPHQIAAIRNVQVGGRRVAATVGSTRAAMSRVRAKGSQIFQAMSPEERRHHGLFAAGREGST
jgi:hypothetical protein